MKPREVMAEVAKLAAERGWEQDSPQETYLLELFAAREDARHSVLSHVKMLRNDLDHVEQLFERPSPVVNTLGELQQRPAAVESAVGQFAATDRALRKYLETFPSRTGES